MKDLVLQEFKDGKEIGSKGYAFFLKMVILSPMSLNDIVWGRGMC